MVREDRIDSISTEELLTVRDGGEQPCFSAAVKITLEKKHITNFEPSAIAFTKGRFEQVQPGEVMTSEQVQRKMWEDMVGSMTLSDVERGIATYAVNGISPQDGWLTRAVLLLKMNPAYASRLSDLFQRSGMSPRVRRRDPSARVWVDDGSQAVGKGQRGGVRSRRRERSAGGTMVRSSCIPPHRRIWRWEPFPDGCQRSRRLA